MLGRARGSGLNHRQRWWRDKRPLQIEEQACALIRRYEGVRGKIPGIVVPPALLVPEVGCELVYFADEERGDYRIPADAIGALDVDERLALVHDSIATPGREAHTIGEEIGHAVLHAKLISPEQQALNLEVPTVQGIRRFTRTEQGALNDERQEPVWMSMEAAYFSACLMMPRDRYGASAEETLRMVMRSRIRRDGRRLRPLTMDERVARARPFAKQIHALNWNAIDFELAHRGVFSTNLIENALYILGTRCEWQVSKAAQKRRLVELGLAHDAADVLVGVDGERVLPRSEFLWVAEHVVEAALEGGDRAVSAENGGH